MEHECIVIGAGTSGLYLSFKLKELGYDVLCLEKTDHVGGRTLETEFNGELVKLGGGVTDLSDVDLLKLLDRFNIKRNKFDFEICYDYLYEHFDINFAVDLVKKKYYKTRDNKTVKDFLDHYFGENFRNLFFKNCEYTDFHNEHIYDFIHFYPIDDVKSQNIEYCVFSYNELTKKMAENINIHFNTNVTNLKKLEDGKFVLNGKYICKKLFFCGTLTPAKQLFKYEFLKNIIAIPFFRIFLKYDRDIKVSKGVVLTEEKVKKFIKINKNTIMMGCDSEYTNFWLNNLDNIINIVKKSLVRFGLDDFKELKWVYWENGTHHFTNNTTQRVDWVIKNMNPEPNVYFCGEMIGLKQGWVQGGLQSVNLLLENYIY